MSTFIALHVETKDYNAQTQQQGLISCEVVVTESTRQFVQLKPNEHVMRLQLRKSRHLHRQRAYVANPTVHHRTTNVPQTQVSNELCKSMIKLLEKIFFHAERLQSSHLFICMNQRDHVYQCT